MLVEQNKIKNILILEDGQMVVNEVIEILRDGAIIASIPIPRTLEPGDTILTETEKIKSHAAIEWTPAVIAEWEKNKPKKDKP